jgi:uncharacterized protein YdaU (DUF1376 family)
MEGGIPKEIQKIAKLCRESKKRMEILWKEISIKFVMEGDMFINKRIEKERKKQEEHRVRRSESGKKGASARWQSHSDRINSPMAKNGSSSSSSSSSSSLKQSTETSSGNYFSLFKKEGPELKKIAEKIEALPNKRSPFNPHQYIQRYVKKGIHPEVILKCLTAIHCYWEEIINSPYAYTSKMMENEMDHHITQGYKQEVFTDIPKEITDLLSGFGREMPLSESETDRKKELQEQAESLKSVQ